MARSPLRRLVRGSLALPGALWEAVRPAPGAPGGPLLGRLRAAVARVAADDDAPPPARAGAPLAVVTTPAPAPSADAPPADGLEEPFARARARLSPQLSELAAAAREAALAIAARLDGELAEVARGLDAATLPSLPRRQRRRAVARLARMLAVARGVEIDAARGRRRDLREVGTAVRQLRALAVQAGAPPRRRS